MSFTIQMPTRVIFGRPAVEALNDELSAAGVERLLLLTDPVVRQQAWFQPLADQVSAAGFGVTVHHQVASSPTVVEVDAAAAMAGSTDAQAVVAVGGGSVLTAAKAVGAVMSNGAGCLSEMRRQGRIERPLPPVFVVPTTAGTGVEVTRSALIVDDPGRPAATLQHPALYPQAAVLDPTLTYSLPAATTAATGVTAFANALEAYCGRQANPFSDQLASTALKAVWAFLPRATANGEDDTARQAMMMAALWAGMAADQAGHGLIRAIAATVSAHLHVHCGMACAMVLPHVLHLNLPAVAPVRNQRLKRLAALDDQADDDALVERLMQFVAYLDLPASLDPRLLPLGDFDWDALAQEAFASPSVAGNPRVASLADCRDILARIRR